MKKVRCINAKPLPGNDVAPPLEEGKIYEVKSEYREPLPNGYLHYDLGLISNYNYITSYHTGVELPNSGQGGIHWCAPIRFIVIEN